MSPIDILHVTWNGQIGGIERLVCDLAEEQRNDPRLQVGVLFADARGHFCDEVRGRGIPVHDLELSSGLTLSWRRLCACVDVMRQYDVLHFHGFTPFLALAAVLSRCPLVFTVHGNFGFGRTKTWRDRAKRPLQALFLRRRRVHVAANSRFAQALARRHLGLPQRRIGVIYNGIRVADSPRDAWPITRADVGIPEKAFVVAAIGRFTSSKRLDRVVEGFAAIANRPEALLVLIGDGPARASLEELVRESGLVSRVLFLGFRTDARQVLRLADVLVVPSQNEPFGLVAIEGLVCGLPVVVFADGGGLLEVVEGARSGLVARDPTHLGALLCQLQYASPASGEPLSQGEDAEVRRRFDVRTMADAYRLLYSKAACRRDTTVAGVNSGVQNACKERPAAVRSVLVRQDHKGVRR